MFSLSKLCAGAAVMALTGALAISLPVHAHHGWGGNEEAITLSGTLVSPVSLSGPHASLQMEDEGGQVWDITLAPAPRTHRSGLREDVIPVGAEISIVGQRNADTSRYEVKTRRVSWNGQDFDVYPPQ